jgi:hypothetical protein
LVAAINGAIQVAGNGTTAAAAAFQKAGILAASHNGQHLAFTSPMTPFQVEAGDVMANALMGNLNDTAGLPLASTVQAPVRRLPETRSCPPASPYESAAPAWPLRWIWC